MQALAIAIVALVATLTLLANLGLGAPLFALLRYVPGGDLTGHFVLYGGVGFAVVGAVARSHVASRFSSARVAGVLAALIALEEASQALIPARAFSPWDLCFSLVGLGVGAAAAIRLAGRQAARPAA